MLRLLYLVEDWVGNLREAERIIPAPPGDPPRLFKEQPEIFATILSAAGRLLDPQDLSDLPRRVINWLTFDDNRHFGDRCATLTEAAVALRHLRLHDIRRTGLPSFSISSSLSWSLYTELGDRRIPQEAGYRLR